MLDKETNNMKRQIEQLPEVAELTINLPFQSAGFIIRGQDELLEAMADKYKAQDARDITKHVAKAALKPVEAVTRPVADKVGSFTTRIATDLTAGLYDRRNGTQFLDMLKQRRQDEKDMRMARRLGLVTVDRCAKHEKQLAEVRKIR
jgi:hypothetical protein